jgi:hypothetical protein
MILYEIFFGRKPYFSNFATINKIKTIKKKNPLNININKKYNQFIFNLLE